MELAVIGTGSSGNAYLLRTSYGSLLLDAGLRWETILRELPDGISEIKACLVTHEHMDHAKAVPQMLKRSMNVVMSKGTQDALERSGNIDYLTPVNRLLTAKEQQALYLPPYMVMPVKAMHDAAEPMAYLIRHEPTSETVLYATDTYMLPNRYPSINHWLVECNYTMEKAKTLLNTPERTRLYNRLMESHMSLERLLTALKSNDLSHTRTIILIHISNERGDSSIMEDSVREATGIRAIAAQAGMTINLGECPF